MVDIMQFELSKDYLERFTQAVEAHEDDFIISSLTGVNPADISELLEEFDIQQSKYVIDLQQKEVGAEIIVGLEEHTREEFLEIFSAQELASYVELMESDDAVDVINGMPFRKQEEVVTAFRDEEMAGHVRDLLKYDEDVAGGLMAKELIQANLNWTIQQCIEEIRKQAERVENIYSVYVVDDLGKLLGRVRLKNIILSENNTRVADIYDKDIVSIDAHAEEEEVATTMQKYDLEALPVINKKGILIGRVTIDDAMDVVTEQAEEDRQMMTGISGDVEEDDTVWVLSKARLPWLVIGLVGGLLGAKFISLFEADIALIPAMAFFIPLITATGGNVGIQSSSIVVQGLASPNAFEDSMFRKMVKVLFVAIVNGLILAVIVFGIVIFSTSDQIIATTVASALFSVVLLSSFMGTITPLLLDRIGVNPAMASGPFITTANDLLGLTIYFMVAHLLYGF
jgi:magnesium transporter